VEKVVYARARTKGDGRSMRQTARRMCLLRLQSRLVRLKRLRPDLRLLRARMLLRQPVRPAEVRGAVRTLAHDLHGCVATLCLGAGAVLAALARATAQAQDEV